jgi:hypothetical protein
VTLTFIAMVAVVDFGPGAPGQGLLGKQVHGMAKVPAARNPKKAASLGIPVVRLDLDQPENIAPALQGIDRAFLVTGYTIDMMRQSKDFLNIAKKVDVKHIVHLGACGDNDTRVTHYGWHQFVERYVEWCGFSLSVRFGTNSAMTPRQARRSLDLEA